MRYLASLIQPFVAVLCVSLIHTEAFAIEIESSERAAEAVQNNSDPKKPSSQEDKSSEPSEVTDEATDTAEAEPAPPPPITLRVSINLSSQRMSVTSNGKSLYSWRISSGRAGYRTPTGSYQPQWLSRMHYSKKYYNSPMPYSVFFHRGFAIHGTYATRRLGSTASHGCIRLAPSNAKRLFRLVQKHGYKQTKISIHGVARDKQRWVSKKPKRHYRKTAYQNQWWFSPPTYTAKPKRYKKKSKPKVSYYKQPAFRWPGD